MPKLPSRLAFNFEQHNPSGTAAMLYKHLGSKTVPFWSKWWNVLDRSIGNTREIPVGFTPYVTYALQKHLI